MNKSGPFGYFNITNFIIVCLRYWRVFAVSVLAFGALAAAYTVLRPAKSEILAQIMIKDDMGASSMLMAGQIARSFSLGDMFGGTSSTDNESHVIGSHAVFLATARQMGLNTTYMKRRLGILWTPMYSEIPVQLKAPAGVADTLSLPIAFRLKHDGADRYKVIVKVKSKTVAETAPQALPITIDTPYGAYTIDKTADFDPETAGDYRITFCSYDNAASSYQEIVNVYVPDRKSDFINLSIVTNAPDFGKDLLNHIISNYMDVSNEYKFGRSAQSLRLVDDRLATLANELLESEHAIENFKKTNSLTDLEVDAKYLMTKTGSLEEAILQAQTRYEVIKLTRDFVNNPANQYELIPELFVSSGAGDAGSTSLVDKYNQLILERMHLLNTARDNSTSVKQLDQQIDALRNNIISSINRIYENTKVALNDLKNENSKNQSRIGQLPTIERQYLTLKRDNLLQEQIYLFLLQQREELNMSLASRAMPAQVIDQPYELPNPAGLTRKVALTLGILLGLLAGATYVLLLKVRCNPVRTGADLAELIRAPQFQQIYLEKANNRIPNLSNDATNAEAFRQLRVQVRDALKQCEGHSLVVTSMIDGEGKTFVAVNLAAALALTGSRVVLVDAALNDPQMANTLGITTDNSTIADYVLGVDWEGGPSPARNVRATDQINASSVSVGEGRTMDVIASSATSFNSSDLLASERFAQMLQTLSADYDYVVIDSAPVSGHSDIYTLTGLTDMTLMVCRVKMTTPDNAEVVNKLYEDARLKRLAVVINGVNK